MMILFVIFFTQGILLGTAIGLLLSTLFERWSSSAADWILRKLKPEGGGK